MAGHGKLASKESKLKRILEMGYCFILMNIWRVGIYVICSTSGNSEASAIKLIYSFHPDRKSWSNLICFISNGFQSGLQIKREAREHEGKCVCNPLCFPSFAFSARPSTGALEPKGGLSPVYVLMLRTSVPMKRHPRRLYSEGQQHKHLLIW